MKKYILALFLITLIIPSVVLASWWNPFSWKIFHKKEVAIPIQDIQTVTNAEVEALKKQIVELKSKTEVELKSKTTNFTENVSKKQHTQVSNTIKDICSNIDGVQIIIPDDYYEENNTCKLLNPPDYCVNIDGIQDSAPPKMVLYKYEGVNICVTQSEIEAIKTKKRNESLCLEKKNLVVDLNKKILDTKKEFQAKIEQFSGRGLTQSQVALETNIINSQRIALEENLHSELSIAQSEIQLYCNQ